MRTIDIRLIALLALLGLVAGFLLAWVNSTIIPVVLEQHQTCTELAEMGLHCGSPR